MGAGVEDIGVLLEEMLGPVAVMDVEVEDGDPGTTVVAAQVLAGHRGVIEVAETHGSIPLGVVPGLPHRGERSAASGRVVRGVERGLDRPPGGVEGASHQGVVRRVQEAVPPLDRSLEAPQVLLAVNLFQAPTSLRMVPPALKAAVGTANGEDPFQPLGDLWKPVRHAMTQAAIVGEDLHCR